MPSYGTHQHAQDSRAAAEPLQSDALAARIPAVAFQNVVGSSAAIREAIALGCKVASHPNTTVLIRGATGTGKELFARGVHYSSENAGEPFVAINCAAIPENLLESELFGHERGAFTGAAMQKRGLLEFAGRGTVFLDEIGEMPPSLQPKLLRVLEEKRVRRLGGFKEQEISCRIIAATNRDLATLVAEGRFREDLYYRLSVFHIEIPAVHEREGDILLLARYFLETFCREKGVVSQGFTPEALTVLTGYHWPGNVRELKNAVEGAVIISEGERIKPEHLTVRRRTTVPAAMSVGTTQVAAVIPIPMTGLKLDEAERQLFTATMRLSENNQSKAARMLGISRPTIIRKLKKYGLLAVLLAASVTVDPARAHAQQRMSAPVRGGTLVVGGSLDLRGMNSLVANENYTSEFLQHVLFMTLARLTPTLQLEPYLATSWKMTGDTAVVFKLRRDIFWHDGVKTSAHDVAFTFERIKDPETAYPDAENFDKWLSVQVVDSFTVRFRMQPHVEPLMPLPFTAIMPKHLLDSIPSARMRQASFNRNPVGNGPFRFVSWRANDRWVFEANPRFPAALGGRPHIDRLIWRVIPETPSQVTELVTGNVHLVTAPGSSNFKTLDARPELRGIIKQSRKYMFVTWNSKRPLLNNPLVRRALSMALDRQQMIDVLKNGYAQVAVGPISPFHWAYDPTMKPLPHDPAAARALLQKTGMRDTNGDGILEDPNGQPFEVQLKVASNNQINRDAGEMIRAALERAGVRVALQPTDFASLVQDISTPERKFDAALMTFESDFRISLRESFHSAELASPFQTASYSNRNMDRMLDRANVTFDRAKARPIWRRVQQLLLDESPWTFIWYAPDLVVINERVQGVQMDIRGTFRGVNSWYLKPGQSAHR
jgi:DNA-binding NtrC family response regulator/ABC-type transport system substrate-binding protein